ncbi:RNA polymerase III subunit Rpc25 domain-containing protein [Plasmodiophora brassicae]
MFVEVDIRDVLRLPAQCIVPDIVPAVHFALLEKYVNRVLNDQGLCVCVRHLSSVGDPYLFPGDGGVHVRVECSLVFFRPFVDEVLVGKVRHSDPSGLLVSLEFTEDVFISKEQFPEPSFFDEEEKLWYWKYLDNEMYIDAGEPIRFRVIAIEYCQEQRDPSPQADDDSVKLMADLRPAMRVQGSIAEDGLGLIKWWVQQPDAASDE